MKMMIKISSNRRKKSGFIISVNQIMKRTNINLILVHVYMILPELNVKESFLTCDHRLLSVTCREDQQAALWDISDKEKREPHI